MHVESMIKEAMGDTSYILKKTSEGYYIASGVSDCIFSDVQLETSGILWLNKFGNAVGAIIHNDLQSFSKLRRPKLIPKP